MLDPTSLELKRLPAHHHVSLRAWDSADEFLVTEAFSVCPNAPWLLVNDAFGAISCMAGSHHHTVVSDSYTSFEALKLNRQNNSLPPVAEISWPDFMASNAAPNFGLVILKLPKIHAFLKQQLQVLNTQLPYGTPILMGAMQKHLDRNVFEWVESCLDRMQPYRAVRKAKCILAYTTQQKVATPPSIGAYTVPSLGQRVSGEANVYSAHQMDNGARLMLEALVKAPKVDRVLDLACGNGILGMAYHSHHATSECTFIDESYQAVASAEHNWLQKDRPKAHFICCNGVPSGMQKVDLVLLNPPFHQGHVVTDHIAHSLFSQSARVLTEDGELWVVGNRHLGYHQHLKPLFNKVECVASNAKFIVLQCKHVKLKVGTC